MFIYLFIDLFVYLFIYLICLLSLYSHDVHDGLLNNEVTTTTPTTTDETDSKFTVSDDDSLSAARKMTKNSSEKDKKVPEMTVIMQLLGPLGNMKIRQIRKTVWFWGILLGLLKHSDFSLKC